MMISECINCPNKNDCATNPQIKKDCVAKIKNRIKELQNEKKVVAAKYDTWINNLKILLESRK